MLINDLKNTSIVQGISAWHWFWLHFSLEILKLLSEGWTTLIAELTPPLWSLVPYWDMWPSTPGWRSQTALGTLFWPFCQSCSRCCMSFWGPEPWFQRVWAAQLCCLKWLRWTCPLWGWLYNSHQLNRYCLAFLIEPMGPSSVEERKMQTHFIYIAGITNYFADMPS